MPLNILRYSLSLFLLFYSLKKQKTKKNQKKTRENKTAKQKTKKTIRKKISIEFWDMMQKKNYLFYSIV